MKETTEIREFFVKSGRYQGTVLLNEPVAQKTTFKIGGTAPLYFEPENTDSLLFTLETLCKNKIQFFILGGGSNIVVSDDGFDGAVISTSRLNDIKFRLVSGSSAEVTCLSGTPTARLVSYCTQNCLSGIEKFAGLPGSIGGALFMNARCFDLSISGLLKSAEYIDLKTMSTVHYDFCENDWDYKRSPFQCGGKILTSATFTIEKKHSDELERIAAECRRYVNERVQKGHFKYPSAGSVFKNNRDFGEPSGKLIDECGLCGKRIGGAQIAPWHGNFIVNTDNATQKDVRDLVDLAVRTVQEKKGFLLQPEIIFCGK